MLAQEYRVQVRAGEAAAAANIYSSDSKHIWNRLFGLFYVRTAPDGRAYGGSELDPYLWQQTKYLLTGPSHDSARSLLDEFVRQHADRLVADALRRALLQRDLWAVYDWLDASGEERELARQRLRQPLGMIVRRLALSEDQIRALPDNYSVAIRSQAFPQSYDPGRREAGFLPDLFKADGAWVCMGQQQERPIAQVHLEFFRGRSVFLVFLRLPGGRNETLAYLEQLRKVPSRWVPIPGFPADSSSRMRSPRPPQFPLGTQVALVRQMVLISDQGKFVPTRVTETVQLRVYRAINPGRNYADNVRFHNEQDVFEFKLDRAKLLAGESGLRAVGPAEKEPTMFLAHGDDIFESSQPPNDIAAEEGPVLSCAGCHYDPGVQSFLSHSRAHFIQPPDPPDLVESTPSRETALDLLWRPQHPELSAELVEQGRKR
jgi:hypothetical protein